MDIKRVGASNVISIYRDNNKISKNSKIEKTKSDSIELSSAAKSLSGLSLDDFKVDNSKKIEKIRNEINQGTYKPNAELVAKKLIDVMKGRGV